MSASVFTEPMDVPATEQDAFPYRAMSKMAMLSFLFGLLSLLGLLVPVLLVFAVLGLIFSLLALRSLRRYPNELSGGSLARIGGVLSAVLLVCGSSYHAVVYATEVPEGYQRISFSVLQAEKDSQAVPASAIQLDDQQVFVAGYIHPDAGMKPVQKFVLVPDMGTCCFGGQPKLTDMIEVILPEKVRLRYSTRKRKLAGVLKVDSRLKPREQLQGVYYQLLVDEVIR